MTCADLIMETRRKSFGISMEFAKAGFPAIIPVRQLKKEK